MFGSISPGTVNESNFEVSILIFWFISIFSTLGCQKIKIVLSHKGPSIVSGDEPNNLTCKENEHGY